MEDGQYIIVGMIHPERATLSIDEHQPYELHINNGEIIFRISIILNRIYITTTLSNCSLNSATLKNIAIDRIRSLTDSIGFQLARAYNVEIISITKSETGHTEVFGIEEPIFDTPPGIDQDYLNDIAQIANMNIPLQRALSDFRDALARPNDTSFFCYRAIESLRHNFGGNKEEQWEHLRKNLKVKRDTIDPLVSSSQALRHGLHQDQTWKQRKEELTVTHEIIRRYILYIKNRPIEHEF